jgi:phosphoribosyl-dephospho-CoA transferase
MMSKTTLFTEGAATGAVTRSADRICIEGDDQKLNASAHPWLQRSRNAASLKRRVEARILRRHDLLRAEPAAWQAMLRGHPSVADLPLAADWARLGRPVIARRRMAGDLSDSLPAALPLPPCYGKLRVAFSFSSGAAVIALPPVSLCDAARTAPAKWKPIISALLNLGESMKISPRVFGALLWEHTTGLPYLHAQSDLDLIWSVSDAQTARLLVERLRRLDAESPVRLDGELQLPDFAGVNWRELAQNNDDERSQVLVKTMDGVEARTKAGLFRTPVCQS